MNWRSLHIHYYSGQDALLSEGVAGIVGTHRKGLSRWFFLRYWKRGPHVRLRLLPNDLGDESLFRTVCAEVDEYLVARPSIGSLPDGFKESLQTMSRLEGDSEYDHEIAPNNTALVSPYEPEYDRYGGEGGVALAERLFEASSDIALDVLNIVKQAQTKRLGIAFAMMLAGLRGAGLNDRGVVDFLAAYCRFWSRYLPGDIADLWNDGIEEKQRTLKSHAAAVLSGEPPPGSQIGENLERWKAAIRDACSEVDASDGAILSKVTTPIKGLPAENRRDFLLLNYLHTHNNRLGVVPGHEAYLAHLAHFVVCSLTGFAPTL